MPTSKKTKSQETYEEVRKLNKQIRKDLKKECNKLIQNKMSSPDPKAFWTCVNKLLGKTVPKPISLKVENKMISDPLELSTLFLDFFNEKVNCLADLRHRPIQKSKHMRPVSPLIFGYEDLQKMLKTVKRKKCFGSDNIPLLVGKDFV